MGYSLKILRQKFEIPDNFILNVDATGGNSLTFYQDKRQADIEIGQDDELLAMAAKVKNGTY